MPDLLAEVHRQWQSYDGFTFAFSDYAAVNITPALDGPIFGEALRIIDPIHYAERLQRLAKVAP